MEYVCVKRDAPRLAAVRSGHTSRVPALLQLQRAAGNRATTALVARMVTPIAVQRSKVTCTWDNDPPRNDQGKLVIELKNINEKTIKDLPLPALNALKQTLNNMRLQGGDHFYISGKKEIVENTLKTRQREQSLEASASGESSKRPRHEPTIGASGPTGSLVGQAPTGQLGLTDQDLARRLDTLRTQLGRHPLVWMLLESPAEHLDYGALAALAGTAGSGGPPNKELQNAVVESLFIRNRMPLATSPELRRGLLGIMGRVNPNRMLSNDPIRDTEQVAPDVAKLVPDMIKHVGWRQYTSKLRPETVTTTLKEFDDETLYHAGLTSMLRQLPDEVRFPTKWLTAPIDNAVSTGLDLWKTHAGELYKQHLSSSSTDPSKADQLAGQLRELIAEDHRGHHISILIGKDANKQPCVVVYTNSPLNNQAIDKITRKIDGLEYKCEVHFDTEDSRKEWTAAHGVKRAEKFDYSFHSEMQPTMEEDPWKLRKHYVASAYRACAQCMMGFAALGLSAGENYWEPHGQKFPSVIPPAIRDNTVYLQHYLGSDAWRQWKQKLEVAAARLSAALLRRGRLVAKTDLNDRFTTECRDLYERIDAVSAVNVAGAKFLQEKDVEILRENVDLVVANKMEKREDSERNLTPLFDCLAKLSETLNEVEIRVVRAQNSQDLQIFFDFLTTIERVGTGRDEGQKGTPFHITGKEHQRNLDASSAK